MEPKFFKESTQTQPKAKMANDEKPMFIHWTDDGQGVKISLWTCSFWQRLKFIFHGNIWIGVMHKDKLPPMWVDCRKTVFKK